MPSRNFKSLMVWHKGIALSAQIYRLTAQLPVEEKYGLTSQLRRAAISVPANIAEGCSRSSDKEFKRFLEIALGSLFEIETFNTIILELGMMQEADNASISVSVTELQRMLQSLIHQVNEQL